MLINDKGVGVALIFIQSLKGHKLFDPQLFEDDISNDISFRRFLHMTFHDRSEAAITFSVGKGRPCQAMPCLMSSIGDRLPGLFT